MSRDVLDQQYNVRLSIPDFQVWFDRFAAEGAQTRAQRAHTADLTYGPDPLQTYDVFPCGSPRRPLLVFIHGGYWRSLDKDQFSQLAAPYLDAGINVALVNYRLAPQVALEDIVSDCANALRRLHADAGRFDFDVNAFYLMGHSAGGHLATLLTAQNVLPVKGVCSISGLYDLEPIRQSYLNDVMQLSEADVRKLSPILHLPPARVKTVLCTGGQESEAFKDQRDRYADVLRQAGRQVEIAQAEQAHHLSIVDVAADPASALTQAVLKMILA